MQMLKGRPAPPLDASPELTDFLSQIFIADPQTRTPISALLTHPWFGLQPADSSHRLSFFQVSHTVARYHERLSSAEQEGPEVSFLAFFVFVFVCFSR